MEKASDRTSIVAAGCIGMAAAFLLCGYEFIRSTANTLFKEKPPIGYGADRLPYVMAAVPVGVLLMVYGYSWLLTRLGPRKTLLVTSLLSGGAIAGCYFAIEAGFRPARAILYVVREAYVVLLIEQYWSFLNSRLGTGNAKKFNGPICGLGSIGAVAGDWFVQHHSHSLGVAPMVFIGAAAIVPALIFSELAYIYCGEPAAAPEDKRHEKDYLALGLFRSNALLGLLLLVIVLTQVLATVLDLSFQTTLQEAYPVAADQNSYQGAYWGILNRLAAVEQFLMCPLLLRFASFEAIHGAIPLINFAFCFAAFSRPSLESMGLAQLMFKVMDYSVFRSAKEMIYIPFSYDVRYRAKEVIDVWGYRFSKGGTAACISFLKLGGTVFTAAKFAAIACGGAALWLIAILPVCKRYTRVQREEAANTISPPKPGNVSAEL